MLKPLYTGLFIDSRELHEKIKKIPEARRLEKLVENPHVTFQYYRDGALKIPQSELGRIVDIEIVGYANDGQNEGVKVKIVGIKNGKKDKLSGILSSKKTPHITISLAEGAKAVNTENLEFVDIKPIEITGVFGVFCDGYKHPFCGAPSNAFEGKYIVPFSIPVEKSGKAFEIKSDFWEPKEIRLRYLASYIRELFARENGIVKAYSLSEDLPIEIVRGYRGRLYDISDARGNSIFKIKLYDVELYCFATGICFLVASVGFDSHAKIGEILQLSATLSYLFNIPDIDLGLTGDDMGKVLSSNIMKIVRDSVSGPIKWFPSTENKKCNGFLRYVAESPGSDDYKMAYRLSRGFTAGAYVSDSMSEDIKRKVYSPIDDRFWMVDSNAIAVVTYLNRNSDLNFIRNVFPSNVDNYYFAEYLLALHERECFLIYNTRAVKNWNNMDELVKLKKEILRLDIWSTYNAVSTDSYYQELYDKLYQELRLEQLETDVEEVVSKAKEYDDDIKEKRTNKMLTAIGLLAIFSALIDGTEFVKKLYGSNVENIGDFGHWIVYGAVIAVIAYSFFSFKDKK